MRTIAQARRPLVRAHAVLAVVVLVAPCLGCLVSDAGPRVLSPKVVQVGVWNKSDVYRHYGVPSDVFHSEDMTVLLYRHDVTRGLRAQLSRGRIPLLGFGHRHEAVDALAVLIDSDGVVEEAVRLDSADLARYRLWPFGP